MSDNEWIEQAVFTSALTDRAAGYQIVAASAGVSEEDSRELAMWGPSHDALLDSAPGAVSINFHTLPSGAFCVARTTPAGWEYSGRGGARVYTQNLLVPPPVLARFGNSPFALLRAAVARGAIRVYDDVPPRLEPFRLPGRASAVDAGLLARLAVHPGPDWLAAMVQAAMASADTLAVVGGPPSEQMIAGLINCFPPECRTAFSFSTGLKFSSRRPFRIVAISDNPDEQRRVERLYNVVVLRPNRQIPSPCEPVDTWPRLIWRALKSGRTTFLASELSKRHHDVGLDDLPALGLQLLEEIEASSLQETAAADAAPVSLASEPAPAAASVVPLAPRPAPDLAQAHAAHPRFEKTAVAVDAVRQVEPPSSGLETADAGSRRQLKLLDDLVHEAICGREDALDRLKTLWPKIHQDLGADLLNRSRESYLRYALTIWEECLDAANARDPFRAIQALDVLCVLFDEG